MLKVRVSPPPFANDFSRRMFLSYILLTDQISLPNRLYFLIYWSICVLQLFVNQVLTSRILKLTLSFQSRSFPTLPKSQDKYLNTLKTKRAFSVK